MSQELLLFASVLPEEQLSVATDTLCHCIHCRTGYIPTENGYQVARRKLEMLGKI